MPIEIDVWSISRSGVEAIDGDDGEVGDGLETAIVSFSLEEDGE